jgi:CheY-like chemotaxis protein
MMETETKIPLALLVDDSEDDAYFFRRTLKKSGFSCSIHHAPNGLAAITFLREALRLGSDKLPCIVFLDLKMPMMNGFEVLVWMQEQGLLSRIPVVVLSGSERQEDRDRAAQYKVMEYSVKPLSSTDLRRILSQICPEREEQACEKLGENA